MCAYVCVNVCVSSQLNPESSFYYQNGAVLGKLGPFAGRRIDSGLGQG